MYKPNPTRNTGLTVNYSYEAEPLERKIERLMTNKEPLVGDIPLTYTERKDGVKPEHNIRTDRWEIAAEAMDKAHRSDIAKRQERHNPPKKDGGEGGEGGQGGENAAAA